MHPSLDFLGNLMRLSDSQTRSISAENPIGGKSGGARASPGDDASCTPASRTLGKGWKVRPCLRSIKPGETITLADVDGPGVIQHIWCTVLDQLHRSIALRIFYDEQSQPSVLSPLGDFFANGVNGLALVNSIPVAVNPRGGMNCYWPMPFRKRIRVEISNDGPKEIPEFFFQITYGLQPVPDDTAYFHALWRRGVTTRDNPEHVILEGAHGRGHYVGTYLVWNQLANQWWGEGEVKFFIDGDAPDSPTICGTGTEDYFGGAWGFLGEDISDQRPRTFGGPFLGYPQAVYESSSKLGQRVPCHGLYRWHIPDPIHFQRDLRVTVQALGWWPDGTYQPLTDDIASVAYWYQSLPTAEFRGLPPMSERWPR